MVDLTSISIVHDDDHVGELFFPNDYRQIRQEIIEQIVKKNPQEWQIKKLCIFDGDYWSRNVGSEKFGWGYKEMEDCLVHQNFKVEYDNHGELLTRDNNGGKVHFKRGFIPNEWQELEQIVRSQPKNLSDDLLSDEQISKVSKEKLTDLLSRILTELDKRKVEQETGNYLVSTEQLESQKEKLESVLSSFSTLPNNNPTKPNNSILLIGGVGLLVIGLIAYYQVKKKN